MLKLRLSDYCKFYIQADSTDVGDGTEDVSFFGCNCGLFKILIV